MKKSKQIIITIAFLNLSLVSKAQWGTIGSAGRTNSTVSKIAIGTLPTEASVFAKLYINSYLLAPNAPTNGLMFRTDGDQNIDNRWQLFTGTSSTLQIERFRVRVLRNSYDTYLERTHVGNEADVRLLSGEVQLRSRNKRLGDFQELTGVLADEIIMGDGSDVNFSALSLLNRRLFVHGTNGFVGMGHRFREIGGISPNYNLHLNDSTAAAVYQQFTNFTSGTGLSDGLRVGLNTTISNEIRSFDQDIFFDIAQSDTVRMRFRDANTSVGLNGSSYLGVNRIMVPLRRSDVNTVPMSMMQLGTSSDGAIGRSWMNVGTTYGTNADAMYVGWMERANRGAGNVQSDAVIAWGCQKGLNDTSRTSDNFRILFIEPTGNAADSAGTVQGKEVFRIEPFSGNVGIGNYSQTSLQPPGNAAYVDAKLDIDGDLRIRSVLQQDTLDRVLVIDPNDRNRVKWRDVETITGICDWNVVNNGGTNDVATGYAGACVERNTGVGISAPTAKLHVVRGVTTPLVIDPVGARVTSTSDAGAGTPVLTLSFNPTTTNSYGTYSTAQTTLATGKSIGGYFRGAGAKDNNIGLYTTFCSNSGSTFNYGIYAFAPPPIGLCGAGTNWAGFFNGDVEIVNGTLSTPTGTVFMSDENIKTDVALMEGATEKLLMLNPVTYHLTNQNCTSLKFPEDLQCGLVAQEVAEVFPDMVEDVIIPNAMEGSEESLTIKGVQYTELIPVLIKGFQEQTKRIQNLEEQLAACCNAGMRTDGGNDGSQIENKESITLDNKNSIILNQNVPNPFAEKTTISYNLPETVTKAQILFYDQKGALINSQEIESRGAGQLVVFADDLSNGSYSYALVVDGKIIDTKTMVKSK